MPSPPIYLGIDLGTTNSAAVVFDGTQVTLVRGAQGATLLPSVVRIDGRGNVSVGAKARRFLETDPANTRAEFKRLMGSQTTLDFPAAGVQKRPEELAAEVLRTIRKDASEQLGVEVERAVVSVPALFELPQTTATAEAARLAGFSRVELIQEPVASAIAAGFRAGESSGAWLVYDLGGGTFDASLLQTEEGLLRVVGHDGDNFLGGRDIDSAIVEWIVSETATKAGVSLERSDPAHAAARKRLRLVAEEAKIELTREKEASLVLPEAFTIDGRTIDVDLVLERAQFEALLLPLVDRSVAVCLHLLASHGVSPGDLQRIVLVGGPTVIPSLRRRVAEALCDRFGEGLDPMTLVAQGAALFAGTVGLDARAETNASKVVTGPRAYLQYPAMTPDLEPFLVGKMLDDADQMSAVEAVREDGDFTSAKEIVDAEGTFALQLMLRPRSANVFRLFATKKDGGRVALHPETLTITHGVTLSDPPLARSIGVALADDRVRTFVQRGAPLPMRRTFTLTTVAAVSPGDSSHALRVPIVQGEFPLAHLCRLVGALEIPGAQLEKRLPAGSDVEVTIELDRGGRLTASARVPSINQVFDHIAHLVVAKVSVEALPAAIQGLRDRLSKLRAECFRSGDSKSLAACASADRVLLDAGMDAELARGGDADSGEKVQRALVDIDAQLAQVEAARAWPAMEEKIRTDVAWAVGWLAGFGNDVEHRSMRESLAAIDRARLSRDVNEVERQLRIVSTLGLAAYYRHPEAWEEQLDHVASRVSEAIDMRKATQAVSRGREAQKRADRAGMEQAVRELWTLLPPDPERRERGHGSGVR